jgi:citrate synthase
MRHETMSGDGRGAGDAGTGAGTGGLRPSSSGLEGVVVAATEISHVDGERGELWLRGHAIEELAGRVTFEAACGLGWTGRLPDAAAAGGLQQALARARLAAFAHLPALGDALSRADGMDALRAAAAHLSPPQEPAGDPHAAAAAVTGSLPVFAAAWARGRAGLDPVAPDPALGTAADFLRMASGQPASAASVHGLETYLVTVLDHGMSASTFTARVVASTGSDLVSAIVAAIGALKGPLHGGAPGPVLDMLDAVRAPERAAGWIDGELAAGRRIMGMGHRVYRVRDPRAQVLERAVEELERAGIASGRLALARAVERAARAALAARHPDRPLHANVEFYTAVLLSAVGLPRELFSPAFAVSRTAGWCAPVAEQRATGRIVRPLSRYVGPTPAGRDAPR